MSTSLHMSALIHVLFLASYTLVLGIIQRRSVKSPSSFTRVIGYRRGDACDARVDFHVPSEWCYGGTQGSSNDPSCSWSPGRTCSYRDNGPYPGCSPSGTAPPSPSQPCSKSLFIGSGGIGMYGSPPKYPPVLPLLDPLKFIRPALLLLGL